MKEDTSTNKIQRRKFLGGLAAACALPCLGMKTLYAMAEDSKSFLNQDPKAAAKHKFDNPFQEVTFQQYFNIRFGEFISLAKDLEEEMGKEELINFLKKRTEKSMFEYGQKQAKDATDNSLQSYVSQYSAEFYDKTLTKEVVQNTEQVFEMKVTECIWAKTFLKQNAGDIGYATICYGDYSWPKGFNSKIRMERDKTLMQGHDCCNHKYILDT